MALTYHVVPAETNRLKCGFCNKSIQKGETLILVLKGRKFYGANCITCNNGKLELEAIEDDQILIDIGGIGQD